MTKHGVRVAIAAPLLALSFAACTGEDGTQPTAPNESTETQETPSQEPTTEAAEEPTEAPTTEAAEEPSAAPEPAGENTAPGTTLKVGDTATLPMENGTKTGVVRVTVTGVDEGTQAELKSLNIKEDVSGMTPYYVKVSAEIVSGDMAGLEPTTDLDAYAGAQGLGQVIEFGEFKPCNGETFEYDAKPGATVESCSIQLAPKGASPDRVEYTEFDTPYDSTDGKPVTWNL